MTSRSPPVVGRDVDGDMFILGEGGAAASFQNGVWSPGIPWSGRTLCDFRAVTIPTEIVRHLANAADALAASLRPSTEGDD